MKVQSIKRFNIEKQMRKLRTSDPKFLNNLTKKIFTSIRRFVYILIQNLIKGETDENDMQLNLNDIDSDSDNVFK